MLDKREFNGTAQPTATPRLLARCVEDDHGGDAVVAFGLRCSADRFVTVAPAASATDIRLWRCVEQANEHFGDQAGSAYLVAADRMDLDRGPARVELPHTRDCGRRAERVVVPPHTADPPADRPLAIGVGDNLPTGAAAAAPEAGLRQRRGATAGQRGP